MLHRTTLLVAGVLTAAAVTGCGHDNTASPTAAKTPARPATSAAPATPTATPTPKPLSKAALEAALLPLSAMPAGYSADPPGKDSEDKTFCNYKQPHQAQVKVSRDFTKGGGVNATVTSIGIRQYSSAQAAAESFDKLEQTLATCHGEMYQGSQMKYSAMSVDQVGDRSLGVRIESDGATILQQFTLDGPVLINVGTGGLVAVDADQTAELLRKQVQRYEAAALS